MDMIISPLEGQDNKWLRRRRNGVVRIRVVVEREFRIIFEGFEEIRGTKAFERQ